MTTEPKHTPQAWLKAQCNRYVNGQCTTRVCLVRGGYAPGTAPVDYSVATCDAHETLILLADNERLRTEYKTAIGDALAENVLVKEDKERLREALKNLMHLHDEEATFLHGDDDNELVSRTLKAARKALSATERP